MDERARAEEHLRVIRSLMERATIYRTLAIPGAIVGGVLSVAAGLYTFARGEALSSTGFYVLWLSVFAITSAVNGVALYRGAVRRGEQFASVGMLTTLRAVGPSFLVAGVLTLITPYPLVACLQWGLFYGLGLMAAGHLVPPAMVWLGRAFLASALIPLLVPAALRHLPWVGTLDPIGSAGLYMTFTFGFFHLVYACSAWTHRHLAPPSA